ncbi:MAG: class I SAM-dependent methyltransferase [Pirellulales bacterium]|nr:class I SAM-dependent methyltransferase [Pirellulales bacterium]
MTHWRDKNRQAWDALARARHPFTLAARDEDFADPVRALDIAGWLTRPLTGARVLCLAAGGGRQSALFAAAGAEVTVVDISPEVLAIDRRVAEERQLNVRVIEGSMDDLSMLAEGSFNLVNQPVSTCYVPDIRAVYREVARVLAPGGLYISQHKQPASLQTELAPSSEAGYLLGERYYRETPLPPVATSMLRETGADEYLHRWEEMIGGMCRAGFVVEDLIEPVHAKPNEPVGSFGHRACYVAPYVRIKARRLGRPPAASLWVPE